MAKFGAVTIAFIFFLQFANLQIFPRNPCPDLFEYVTSNGVTFGRMEFPNDYSGQYTLSVNMSVATLISGNKNIELQLRTSSDQLRAGSPVVFDVFFPTQQVLPKPTQIDFNGKIYCRSPPEEVRPGISGVTNMWASTYKAVGIPSGPIRPNPPPRPVTQTTNPPIFIQENDPSVISINRPSSNPSNSPSFFENNPFLTSEAPPPFRPSIVTTVRPITTTTKPTTTTTKPTTTRRRPPPTTVTTTTARPGQQCGLISTSQHLIVNGDSIEEGDYPWIAALLYRKDLDYKYRCTGSLVSSVHVITAAHCVQFFKALLFPVEDLITVLGITDIRNWATTNGAVLRGVQSVVTHPDYKQKKGDGDIAVLKLKEAVEFQELVQPVCLWLENDDLGPIIGKHGTVIGWGRDESGRDFVAEAKKINIPIVEQVVCLRSDGGFTEITSNRTFCAGSLDGSGPCTGDSGAGYVMNVRGRWMLRGIVSTALRDSTTCDLSKYSVFADVAKFKDWLRDAMV